MFAVTQSAALVGVEAHPVDVEVNTGEAGELRFILVGLPDTAVKESQDRVFSAVTNSGYPMPATRTTINLAPGGLRKEGPAYDLPIAIARIFNVVGPGQDERHVCGHWMGKLSAIATAEEAAQMQVGALHTTRDMIDVRDTAAACIALSYKAVPGEIYNVGTGTESSMRDVLESSLRIAGLFNAVEISEVPNRSVDILRHCADVRKLCALGWKPRVALEDSLQDLYEYYANHVANLETMGRIGNLASAKTPRSVNTSEIQDVTQT